MRCDWLSKHPQGGGELRLILKVKKRTQFQSTLFKEGDFITGEIIVVAIFNQILEAK